MVIFGLAMYAPPHQSLDVCPPGLIKFILDSKYFLYQKTKTRQDYIWVRFMLNLIDTVYYHRNTVTL